MPFYPMPFFQTLYQTGTLWQNGWLLNHLTTMYTSAVAIPCLTCPICPIFWGQVRNFNLPVLEQGPQLLLQRVSRLWYTMYILFLLLEENICCGYSLEVLQCGAANKFLQYMFLLKNKKNVNFRASKFWLDKWRPFTCPWTSKKILFPQPWPTL